MPPVLQGGHLFFPQALGERSSLVRALEAVVGAGWESALPVGNLPSLWPLFLVRFPRLELERAFSHQGVYFPAVSDVGKSRMLRLERSRAAVKDFLGTGLGTQPSDRWVPAHRKTNQDGPGTAEPSGDFNLPQPWRLSKPENPLAQLHLKICVSKYHQAQEKSFPRIPLPNLSQNCLVSLPPTATPANLQSEAGLPEL